MNRNDLKLFKPERLGNDDNAGGLRTRNEVTNGKVNDLFLPISDIDHAQSAIDIVKCYPSLDTPGTETLLDAHVFFSEPPSDPLVTMLLAESIGMTDAAKLSDMREMLESDVVAGQKLRAGMSGFLQYQNAFSTANLERWDYVGNEPQYVRLRAGDIIAICVEYGGNDDGNWPRLTHYAQVTQGGSNSSRGMITFEPGIPFATPDSDVVINNDTQCTVLRMINRTSQVKYHGVSKLAEASAGQILKVEETVQGLLPTVSSSVNHSGLSLSTNGADLVKKTLTQVATSAQTYLFSVTDVLQSDLHTVDFMPEIQYTANGKLYSGADAIITVANNEISATLSRKPDINTAVTVSYISSIRYAVHYYAEPFPAGKDIIRGTFTGRVNWSIGSSSESLYELEDGLYVRRGDGSEYRAAILNYSDGTFILEEGFSSLVYHALVGGSESDTGVQFSIPYNAILFTSFYLQVETVTGSLLSASSDEGGVITGTSISGSISGRFVDISFSQAVKLSTLRYDISEVVDLLPPPEIYNLNPLRLPEKGLVDIFHPWGTISIQHVQFQAVNSPAPGGTVNIRADADFVDITDSLGASLWTGTNDHYSVNKVTGVVTLNSDFTGFIAPFIISDTLSERALVTSVESGQLQLAKALSRSYPIGATVSSVQILGDQQARIENVRDLAVWSDNWEVDGAGATASMNTIDYPIVVTNDAAINEDWLIQFTSATAFNFIGRRVGFIASGDTLNNFTPLNPLAGKPYLTIPKEAFGGGWVPGEAVRFKSVAAGSGIMPIRVVESGHSVVTKDQTTLVYRGNEA